MYGLFTKMCAGAVISAGVSVLGLSYLCTDQPSNRHPSPAAVVALQADAAVGAGVVSSPAHGPSNHNPGSSSPGSNNSSGATANPGNSNPGANNNPGSNNPGSTNPGPNHPAPDCGCATNTPPLVNVKPDVDVDVDVVVTLPDTDVNAPGLVGGVLGTVGTVVDVVLPDCGCSPVGDLPATLPLPLLGH